MPNHPVSNRKVREQVAREAQNQIEIARLIGAQQQLIAAHSDVIGGSFWRRVRWFVLGT